MNIQNKPIFYITILDSFFQNKDKCVFLLFSWHEGQAHNQLSLFIHYRHETKNDMRAKHKL